MKRPSLTYRTTPPEWRDTSTWREADLSAVGEEARERFKRYAAGISLYTRGGRLKDAAQAAGCSAPSLIQQLNRCLLQQPDGNLLGWPGLIEGMRVKEYERHAPLPSGAGKATDSSPGAFKKFLLDHPKLKNAIDLAITKGIGTKKARSLKNTQKSIWLLFLRECVRETITDDQYPLNSNSRGRRSLERYVKRLVDTNAGSVRPWVGIDASKALQIGSGRFSFSIVEMPCDLAGADAHKQDCIGSIKINGPAGSQRVAVQRIWIYAIADFDSRAVAGYSVSIRSEPSALLLEDAIEMSQRPWSKRDLKMPGVHYREGAGFPCGCVEGLAAYRPAAIRMDNGMPGYSNVMAHRVRRRLGCALTFGAIGAWWHNHIIERVFDRLERCGIHRLSSSTGSSANDPMRGNAVAQAIKQEVDWEELVDLIDVGFGNYNAEPQAGLGHRSPLEYLRDCLSENKTRFQPALPVPPTVGTPELGVAVETRVVRGAREPGKYRRAHVQIDKATYTNDELSTHLDWVGKSLTIHIRENEDMRTVKAFLPNGQPIGELLVRERGWRSTKHTRDVRKTINRLRDSRELSSDGYDYVADYLEYLARKAVIDARRRPGKVSKAASALAEVVRTTGEAVPEVDGVPRLRLVTEVPARPVPSCVKRPSWG